MFDNPDCKLHILIQTPYVEDNTIDWMAYRENELLSFDKAYKNGLLKKQLKMALDFLINHLSDERFFVRSFNAPVPGRIIMTDYVAYFHPYKKDRHGIDSPVIKYKRGGEMYECYLRYFDHIWSNSKSVSDIVEVVHNKTNSADTKSRAAD